MLLPHQWYPICRSHSLKEKPLSRVIGEVSYVLFRDAQAKAHALLDRCPHRNVPLSQGRTVNHELECAYHGWRFNSRGQCSKIPHLASTEKLPSISVNAYQTKEESGMIWIYPHLNEEAPSLELPKNRPSSSKIFLDYLCPTSLFHTAENQLDVTHTSFLHKGWFRNSPEKEISVQLRHQPSSIEVEYQGEDIPSGLLTRILGLQKKGQLKHVDRFYSPCISQVDYALGPYHLFIESFLCPVSPYETQVFSSLYYNLGFFSFALKAIALPMGKKILDQDLKLLKHQNQNIHRFKGEQLLSLKTDFWAHSLTKLIEGKTLNLLEKTYKIRV